VFIVSQKKKTKEKKEKKKKKPFVLEFRYFTMIQQPGLCFNYLFLK
jgi:hypothetical protein